MKKPKLAIIGTGNIAHFHCEAFKKAGFIISHGAASYNSKNVESFCKKHGIKKIYSDPVGILKDSSEWDAILLSPPTKYNIDYIEEIFSINKTALIEKPVATNPQYLSKFKKNSHNNIRVAYNRRFYATTQRAKNFIEKEGFINARMELPEIVNTSEGYESVLLNSAHGIDLLNYLFPSLKILKNIHFENDQGRMVIFKAKNGIINLTMNWNSSSNFILHLEAETLRLEMKPFEQCNIFKGMEVIEPTKKLPLRRYIPKKIESVSSFPTQDNLIKPGFYEQAMEIKSLLEGEKPKISASLYDAYITQKILNNILV